jgi:myo-inositol-1(or 4)-monophosphatase
VTTDLLALAVSAAEEAGRLLLEHQGRRLTVETKSSATDPVSEADRASEALVVERIRARRPDDAIVGEEAAGDRSGTTGLRWVIDPLDGTVNYLYGIPQWCVSIAVEDDDGPVVGVVHHPDRGETFRASRGGGAWLGHRRLAVTPVDRLDRTLLATGFAYDPATRASQGRDAAELLTRVRDLRRAGAAALDLAWVAAGRLDAYLEFGLQPWDWAAGVLLVAEAGGVVTHHRRVLGGEERRGLLAAGAGVHGALSGWLEDAPLR